MSKRIRSAYARLVPAGALILAPVLSSCGGGGPAPSPATPSAAASEEAWRALATPRPEPLAGAPRVAVGALMLLDDPWKLNSPVDLSLGLSELVVTGLLRRRDVVLVERRRFAAAAERERRGLPRAPGSPPAGVSPGAEFVLSGTWARLGLDSAYLELRLTDVQTGTVAKTWRAATANDADPVALARTVVGSLLSALDAMGRRPAWADPHPEAAPPGYRPSGIPPAAVAAFLRGLAAEERWAWEGARRAYEAAIKAGGGAFFEAASALARTARLRMGGTLGAS